MKESAKHIGEEGEAQALDYLVQNGCLPLRRNYRAGRYEIDLIVMDGAYLVFTEVKARSTDAFGTPGAFVDRRKQRHILQAAMRYLQENRLGDVPCRFDVVEVYRAEGRIRWIKNAFTAENVF